MRITFLGTGTAVSSPKIKNKPHRSYSSILIEIGDDKLLFDIGPGTLYKMLLQSINILTYPTHLFITHYHVDHCLDLISLIDSRTLNFAVPLVKPQGPLKIYGPIGLNELINNWFCSVKAWLSTKEKLRQYLVIKTKEVSEGIVEENDRWKVTCIPVSHKDGVAYRIESGNKSFVYSGDMGYDENIIKLSKNADLVVLECNFPDRKSVKGIHLCPEDIVKLSHLGNFKNIILTHLYPLCEGKEEKIKTFIEKNTDSRVVVAYDFLQINL